MTARTPSSSCRTSRTAARRDAHIADVTLVIDGKTLKSHATGASYQAALDVVVDKVERQAIDFKEKPRVRARPEEEKKLLREIADGTSDTAPERQIVKTKRFAIEPMFEEDAVTAMEELGHDFYVFVNAENEQRRRPLQAQGRPLRADRAGRRRAVHGEGYAPGASAGSSAAGPGLAAVRPDPARPARELRRGPVCGTAPPRGPRSARRTGTGGATATSGWNSASRCVDLLLGVRRGPR